MKKIIYQKNIIIGIIIISIVLLMILVSFFYTPYPPDAMNAKLKNVSPSLNNIFGTDNFGRDIFSRVMVGARTTFIISFSAMLIGLFFGIIIGAVTGYYGGLLDEVLMRINDALLAFPSILLALVFVSIIGTGKYNVILALGILFIPSISRVVRSEIMRYKELEFVSSAKLMGAGSLRIIFFHILPNTIPILLSTALIGFNNAVLAEAGMSFLGLGVQPPDASLGRMLSEAQSSLFIAPWYALSAGIMTIVMILGFGIFQDGLGDWISKR